MKKVLIKIYNYLKAFFVKPKISPKQKIGYYAVLEEGRIVMNDKAIVGIIVNGQSKGGPFQPDFNAKKPFHKKY
jgi:hypothetical protein